MAPTAPAGRIAPDQTRPPDARSPAADRARRWAHIAEYRDDLVGLARRLGAGPDAEDVVHEALISAALYEQLDETRVRPFLVRVTTRRVTDRHRRVARDRTLRTNRGLIPQSRSFEPDVLDHAEACWALTQLAETLPSEITDLLQRHHLEHVTWNDLAFGLGENVNTLKSRVHRALAPAARRIELVRRQA